MRAAFRFAPVAYMHVTRACALRGRKREAPPKRGHSEEEDAKSCLLLKRHRGAWVPRLENQKHNNGRNRHTRKQSEESIIIGHCVFHPVNQWRALAGRLDPKSSVPFQLGWLICSAAYEVDLDTLSVNS
jgi:hypothetical protein